jgi:hypothetical protein
MITIPQIKPLVAVIAFGASILFVTPVTAQSNSEAQSANSLSVVMEFLSNTTPDKVEAAAASLAAPDATYVSLNFDNPEPKKILPWTGTNKGPKAFSGLFLQITGRLKTLPSLQKSPPVRTWQFSVRLPTGQ